MQQTALQNKQLKMANKQLKYLAGIVANFAVMYGLLRGVRLFVQKFFRFLNNGKPYNPQLILFFFGKLRSISMLPFRPDSCELC